MSEQLVDERIRNTRSCQSCCERMTALVDGKRRQAGELTITAVAEGVAKKAILTVFKQRGLLICICLQFWRSKPCYNLANRLEGGSGVKRPSLGSILLGLVPFAATCFSVALWDRVYPTVLGLPFNVFWLILWLLLTPACMCWAYWLEISPPRNTDQGKGDTH